MKKNVEIIVLFLLLFAPSLRAIYKYLPYPEFASILLGVLLLLFYLMLFNNTFFKRFLDSPAKIILFVVVIISVYIIISFFIYPIADARKLVGKGSTGDDAIIETARQFYLTGQMYDVTLQGDTPVSPGPGWILLNSIFVFSNSYFLLTPAYILCSLLIYLRLFKYNAAPVLILMLLSSSLIFWELMVTGHDLIAIGFCFTIILMLLYHYCIESDIQTFSLPVFMIAVFIGVIATSRIVFMLLPFLCGLLTCKFVFSKAIVITLMSLAIAFFLHLLFYLRSGFYQPLHLLCRGESHVGLSLIMIGGALTIALAIVAYFSINNTFNSFSAWFFVLIFTPLAFIALGEYLFVDAKFAVWEGANYIVPAMPLYLLYISHQHASDLRGVKPGKANPAGCSGVKTG